MLKPLCLAAVCPLLLASSEPAVPGWQLGWMVAGIFGLVGMANQGLELWGKLFHKVPSDAQTYATKAELAAVLEELRALREDHEEDLGRIERRFQDWLESVSAEHKAEAAREGRFREDMERAIGRLEALTAPKPRAR
jgi:hypothetical protein